jgi:hypothetical protein
MTTENVTPIPELIALEIVRRLEQITVANGYQFNVAEVVRPNKDGSNWTYQHLGIGVVQRDDVVNESLSYPGNPPAECRDVVYIITCITRDANGPKATSENLMLASVFKAIRDGDAWHRFGGYAIDAEIGDSRNINLQEGEFDGMEIELKVSYRISELDPFLVMP